MKKISLVYVLILCLKIVHADSLGPYIGAGYGYTFNSLSATTSAADGSTSSENVTQNPYDIRAFVGFQFFSFLGIEAGYNYIGPSGNFSNVGSISSTIYDLSLTPGYSLPGLPLTIFGRVGVAANASSFNNTGTNQATNVMNYNFEWGFGAKLDIPTTGFFVRADYINYGNTTLSSGTSNITSTPSVAMASLGYTF